VLCVLPGAGHLDGAAVRVAVAAHAFDDALGEEDPDLLVVLELRVALERRKGRPPRVLVACRIERQPVPGAEPRIALGPEVGPRPRDREVDIEDHGTEHGVRRYPFPLSGCGAAW